MAIRFDAGGDEFWRAANNPSANGPWSLSMWMRPTNWNASTWYGVQVNNSAGGSYTAYHWVGSNATGANPIMIDADGTTAAGSTITAGTWYHVLIVRGAVTNRSDLYLDGALDAQVTAAVGANASQEMHIGNDGAASNFDGRIAAVKWWNVALSAAEREAERWQILPVRMAGLQAFYPMWTSGDNEDYSGLGRDATLAGTLTTEDGPPIPWMAMPPRWRFLASAGGADTNITPGAGDLVLSAVAPIRLFDHLRQGAAADLTMSGTAPTRAHAHQRQGAAADLTLSPVAPTRSLDHNRSGDAAQLALTTTAPARVYAHLRQGDAGQLVLEAFAPSLAGGINISPGAAQLLLSSVAPARVTAHQRAVGSADLTIDGKSSGRSVATLIETPQGDLVLSLTAPTELLDHFRTGDAAQLTLGGSAPTRLQAHLRVSTTGQLVLSATAPTVVDSGVSLVATFGNTWTVEFSDREWGITYTSREWTLEHASREWDVDVDDS